MRFGRLTVLELLSERCKSGGHKQYLCKCECGRDSVCPAGRLRRGSKRSCGCLQSELSAERCRERLTTHGLSKHPLYLTWTNMRERCLNPECPAYPRYGGRGITICERWADVRNFIEDVPPRPSKHHTLDRIDNDRGYEPGNVRWASPKEQSRNRRNRRLLTVGGVTKLMVEWAEVTGISMQTIHRRLKLGWDDERAVLTPVGG